MGDGFFRQRSDRGPEAPFVDVLIEREAFLEEYRSTGKRLDMGKSCVRFRRIDELPVELIGHAIAQSSVEDFIATTEAARTAR